MSDFFIRPCVVADRPMLLDLLRLNIPRFFAASESADFEKYLSTEAIHYFVLCEGDRVIGGGGINYFPEKRCASISWDVLHPHYQGRGLGTRLLEYRVGLIRLQPTLERIIVRTSQLSFGFYQKCGFRELRRQADFWAPGYDLVEMQLTR